VKDVASIAAERASDANLKLKTPMGFSVLLSSDKIVLS
jgi:hypothetical protein